MTFWNGRRVLLTGGGGFLGRALRAKLESLGGVELLAPRSTELDLRDPNAVRDYVHAQRPQLVIHAAAVVGGIGANRDHPGRFFYENAVMGLHLIEQCRLAGVEKFVCIGTVCAYPKFTPVPFQESALWDGYPEETNAPYGLAKKMLLVQLQAYRAEYGFRGTFLLPANLYGPHDNFDLHTSHVIPAMIRKFDTATRNGDETVALWGDGTPTREFLYVDDAADGIVLAAERYDSPEPVNLGTGDEHSIAGIAAMIAEQTNFRGRIAWDTSKPNGQPRRKLDTSRAAEAFGFRATTPFSAGLSRTIEWWRSQS
ncbi:MAG TPA: GDP-L-fucose synthase [Thermoanaerobaculia bacterium]|nr:GDP-L-fucose synthase [Thermoanaerobaculia bacterium]